MGENLRDAPQSQVLMFGPPEKIKALSVCVGAAGFFLLLWLCLLRVPDAQAPVHVVSKRDSAVTLLVWTHPFKRHHTLPDCSARFGIRGCTVTDDRNAYPKADAVIFHHRDLVTGTVHLPNTPRPRAQKWIWMNYESPARTYATRFFEDVFNLTLTYRKDSDIYLPFGYLVHREHKTRDVKLRVPSLFFVVRRRLIAWFVNSISDSQVHQGFYNQLGRYLQVDVFGASYRNLSKSRATRLMEQYQFFLALENSQDPEYVTQKLWNAILAGAVPVVMGPSRKDYERFLPPEAFIHVHDFATVRELAAYLLTLKSNTVQLRRHMVWRNSFSVHRTSFWAEQYCVACSAVQMSTGRMEVVNNLTRWSDL